MLRCIAADVRELFRLIDWLMELPAVLETLFWEDLSQFQQESRMPFITTPERIGMKKGLLEGLEVALRIKFGDAGAQLMPEIRALDNIDKYDAVYDAIESANTIDDVRKVWAESP